MTLARAPDATHTRADHSLPPKHASEPPPLPSTRPVALLAALLVTWKQLEHARITCFARTHCASSWPMRVSFIASTFSMVPSRVSSSTTVCLSVSFSAVMSAAVVSSSVIFSFCRSLRGSRVNAARRLRVSGAAARHAVRPRDLPLRTAHC